MLRAVLTTTIDLIPDYLAITAVSLDEKETFISSKRAPYGACGDTLTLGHAHRPAFTEISSLQGSHSLLNATAGML